MKVKCIANIMEDDKKCGEEIKNIKYNIEIGKSYTIYAMIFWGGSLDYLVTSDSENPNWYPAELFEVVDHLLPLVWYFTFKKYKNYKGEDSQIAIWGYKEMIADPSHYIALTEEKQEALDIFLKRKQQIDEYEEIKSD